uniref:Ribosomal protein S18 n=1 Tax=Romanomermis culicivorax TaxID=13658 RepID=A0A915HP54_ROMCU
MHLFGKRKPRNSKFNQAPFRKSRFSQRRLQLLQREEKQYILRHHKS